MNLLLVNWLLFTALASVATMVILWRFCQLLPIRRSLSLQAIMVGYAVMLAAYVTGYPIIGFLALTIASLVVAFALGYFAYTGRAFDDSDAGTVSEESVTFDQAVVDWERAEAYRERIQKKSPEFLQRAMLIVIDAELRLMIDEQLAMYRSRRHIHNVA